MTDPSLYILILSLIVKPVIRGWVRVGWNPASNFRDTEDAN